jgi:hypothetical protein
MISRLLAGLGSAAIAAAAIVWVLPALAQEEVLEQNNDVKATYWSPIISTLYVEPQDAQAKWPEGDGPPTFETDPDNPIINPPFKLGLNRVPPDRAPTLDTDWLVLQQKLGEGEPASGWLVALEFGQDRLWVHRVFDEGGMVGYPEAVKLYIRFAANLATESLEIPKELQPAGGFQGAARRQFILENIQIVSGQLKITELDGVRLNGMGGTETETELASYDFSNWTLAKLSQEKGGIEFIPRRATTSDSDLLNGVIQVSFELVLKLDPALSDGNAGPEQKTIKGAIRFAIGKQLLDITEIGAEQDTKN